MRWRLIEKEKYKMKIAVKAKTKAKLEKVERVEQPSLGFDKDIIKTISYKVSVKEAPEKGRANEAIARLLANYFHTSLSGVRLISGQTSKQKIFEIDEAVV